MYLVNIYLIFIISERRQCIHLKKLQKLLYYGFGEIMKVCPKCGSNKVNWIIPQNWSVWECRDCNYTGPIIEIDSKQPKETNYGQPEINERRKRRKKRKKKSWLKSKNTDEEELSDEEIDKKLEILGI